MNHEIIIRSTPFFSILQVFCSKINVVLLGESWTYRGRLRSFHTFTGSVHSSRWDVAQGERGGKGTKYDLFNLLFVGADGVAIFFWGGGWNMIKV